ncbi:MAG: alpha/beta fold hydrolase [Phycisphaerales bacterium]|nr:MAG: alpha/beta fold hydrolase [Phycisphaerales bacterium]
MRTGVGARSPVRRPPMPAMLTLILTLLASIAFAPSALADPLHPDEPTLARRGVLGVQLGYADGDARGVAIAGLIPGGAAERAGVLAGDRITAINDHPTPTHQALSDALRHGAEGQALQLTLWRQGETITRPVTLARRALELPGTTTTYGEVMTHHGYAVRSILTRPDDADGPLPAVFFIQGISCGSMDATTIADRGLLKCIQDVARAGYAVFMVDKPGVGDSAGPPCDEYGFDEEMQAFRAALTTLKSHPDIDPSRVFLVGISMGGIQAPLLAAEQDVAGVVVFGTGFVPWTEYMIANVRRQAALTGANAAQLNLVADAYAKFWSLLLYARLHPSEILDRHPDLAQYGFQPTDSVSAGRSVRFFTELHDSQWANAWSLVETHVLAIHGSYDFVCDRRDHEWIVEVINTLNPGKAEFFSADRMCHGMTVWESERQAIRSGMGTGEPSDAATEAMLAFFERAGGK